jgi:hypothetical protein
MLVFHPKIEKMEQKIRLSQLPRHAISERRTVDSNRALGTGTVSCTKWQRTAYTGLPVIKGGGLMTRIK